MKTVNETPISADKSKSKEPSWFTQAKETIANEKQQNLVKKELEKIQKEEEKVIKLKERVKSVKMSKDKTGNQKPASWKESKGTDELLKDAEEELLLQEFESDESDSDNEDLNEILVLYLIHIYQKTIKP